MPIERGKDWGDDAAFGLVDVIATTDAEVRTVVEESWANGTEIPPIVNFNAVDLAIDLDVLYILCSNNGVIALNLTEF